MPWPCRGVAVLVGLMCIPAEPIRPHPNLTCNLQVAACSIRGGAHVLTVRAAFLSLLFFSCNCFGFAFVFFFSAPLLVNWDPIWLRTIVTVLLVTVRDPRNNNTLQKGRREETSTKESFERPSRRPFPPHHLNFFLPSQSSILFLFLYHSFAGKSLFSACSNSAIACFIIAGACFSVLPTGTGTDTDIGAAPSLCFSRPQLPTAPSFVFNCRSRNLKLSVQPKSFVSHILSFHFARVFSLYPPPRDTNDRLTPSLIGETRHSICCLFVCLFVRPAIIWFRLASSRLRIVPRCYPFSLIVIVGVCGLQRFLLLEPSSQVRSGLSTQNSQAHGLNDDEHPLRFQHRRPTPLEC